MSMAAPRKSVLVVSWGDSGWPPAGDTRTIMLISTCLSRTFVLDIVVPLYYYCNSLIYHV